MRALATAILAACSFQPAQLSSDAHRADGHGASGVPDAAHDAPTDAPHVCSPTAYTFQDPATSVRYRFTAAATWQGAEADCNGDGNHLVKIEDASEDAYLFDNLIGTGFFWIGLYDPQSTDTYVWDDGSPLGSYTNFNGTVPASASKDCIDESFSSGMWADWFCDPQSQGSALQVGVCECDP